MTRAPFGVHQLFGHGDARASPLMEDPLGGDVGLGRALGELASERAAAGRKVGRIDDPSDQSPCFELLGRIDLRAGPAPSPVTVAGLATPGL